MKTNARLVLALALAVAGGCATGGIHSPEGWNVVKTKHFNFYSGAGAAVHDETLNVLEYHHAALSSSFFREGTQSTDVVFLEAVDFDGLMGTIRDSAALARVPGGGTIGKDGLVIVAAQSSPSAGQEALTHIFINRAVPNAPLWFHEGFSGWARNAEYKEGGGQRFACFGYPTGKDFTFVPLEKLVGMGWDDYNGDEGRSWFKESARVFVDYVMHAEGGKRRPAMGAIVNALSEGKPSDAVIKAALPDLPMAQLNQKVNEFAREVKHQADSNKMARGECPIGFPVPEDRAPDLGERKLEPVPPADMAALLDGLKKLPAREDGFPPWYPAEVIARAEGGAAK